MATVTSATRHLPNDRWPSVLRDKLGPDFCVIAEGLNGCTTVFDDPIDGAHKNGRTYLLACLESHAPLDLVIIMLGTNDLKSRFGLGAHDIAAGAGQLVKLVSADLRGQNGIRPQVLLVCPCPIGPLKLLSDMFAGGVEKSQRLHVFYTQIAALLGCHLLNAGTYVCCSPVDGVHLDAEQQHALGLAIADTVQEIFA